MITKSATITSRSREIGIGKSEECAQIRLNTERILWSSASPKNCSPAR